MSSHEIEIDATSLPICEYPECGRVFTTHRGLASHMKKHAEGSACPVCGETVRYLVPHLRKHHAEDDDGMSALVDSVHSLVTEIRRLRRENAELLDWKESHDCLS